MNRPLPPQTAVLPPHGASRPAPRPALAQDSPPSAGREEGPRLRAARNPWPLALALALACGACASGATQTSRRAWDDALARRNDPGAGGAQTTGPRGTTRPTRSGDAWQQLTQFTRDAVDMLADGKTTVSLPRLAKQLCDEVPEKLSADPAIDAVECAPRQPLTPQGHDLRLDLGRDSVIGLRADELTDQASEQLVRQSMQRLASACAEPWTPVPRGADDALKEFHTCPTPSGALLSVGRLPNDASGGRWRFSLAVLGPG